MEQEVDSWFGLAVYETNETYESQWAVWTTESFMCSLEGFGW